MLVQRSDGSPCIKVLDFGISKVVGGSGGGEGFNLTKTAAVLGSPLYMSPEQMMSPRDVDSRTDIWAIGSILYELLTGHTPFDADSLPALGVKIATEQYVPARSRRAEIPQQLEWVLGRCLAKRREERFATVADLAQALAPLAPLRSRVSIDRASGILRGPHVPPPSSSAAVAPGPSTVASWGQTSPEGAAPTRSRSKTPMIAGSAVLLVGAAAALFFTMRHGTPANEPAAASVGPTASVAAVLPSHAPQVAPPPVPTPIETLAPARSSLPAPEAPPASASSKPPLAPAASAHPASTPAAPVTARSLPVAPAAPAQTAKKPSNYDDM